MRGRKPGSRSLKLVTGTYRGDRQRKGIAAEGALIDAPVPDDLSASQRAIWTDTLQAAPHDLLFLADRELFTSYVVAVDLRQQCLRTINEGAPLVVQGCRGMVGNPLIAAANRQAVLIAQLADALGLSPAGRARLGGRIRAVKHDPGEAFFDRPKGA